MMKSVFLRLCCGVLAAAILLAATGCSIGGNRSAEDSAHLDLIPFRGSTEAAETVAAETTASVTDTETTTAAKATETTTATQAPVTKSTVSGWKEAYRAFLLQYLADEEISDTTMFELIYLDDDDVPELVVSDVGFHLSSAHLYACIGSRVSHVADLGSYGGFSYERRTGMIVYGDISQGYSFTEICEYRNGTVKDVWSCSDDELAAGEENATYTVNGTVVSKAEYEAAFNEQTAGHSLMRAPDEKSASFLTRENVQAL